jgi:hypothetical protein
MSCSYGQLKSRFGYLDDEFEGVRASLVVLDPHLHLHFFIRDADADTGKCPIGSCFGKLRMKMDAGIADLLA